MFGIELHRMIPSAWLLFWWQAVVTLNRVNRKLTEHEKRKKREKKLVRVPRGSLTIRALTLFDSLLFILALSASATAIAATTITAALAFFSFFEFEKLLPRQWPRVALLLRPRLNWKTKWWLWIQRRMQSFAMMMHSRKRFETMHPGKRSELQTKYSISSRYASLADQYNNYILAHTFSSVCESRQLHLSRWWFIQGLVVYTR